MNHSAVLLPVLPVLVPLMAVIALLLLYRTLAGQRIVGTIALVLNLAGALVLLWSTCFAGTGDLTQAEAEGYAGRVLVSQMGNWPAPFGITIAIDTFSAMLLCVTAAVSLGVYLHVLTQTPLRFASGYFHPLFQLMLLGVNWAFITGDLFNLFVSFELLLLASYALLVNGTTTRQMRQAYKYVVLNLLVSSLFVAACGWIYGTLGTLNFAELASLSAQGRVGGDAALAAAVLLMAFGTKAAAFPLWYWLPDTYPTLPPSLAGLFAGLLTKVGVYALVRVFVMCFHQAQDVADAVAPLILFSAGGTMFLGVLGAVSSRTIRRILSNHVISQVGYMILGIGLATGYLVSDEAAILAIAATLLYMIQHMVVKCSLFLCCGMIEKYTGTDDLDRFGSIIQRDVFLAVLFLVAALSLVGLPPLSGFFGKFLLIRGSFSRGDAWGWILGGLAITTGALTLLSMAKIWTYGFWSEPHPDEDEPPLPMNYVPPRRMAGLLPVAGLVGIALCIGLGAGFFFGIAEVAARGIIKPGGYIQAVLGTATPPAGTLPVTPTATIEGVEFVHPEPGGLP